MRDGASAALSFSPAWETVYWPILLLAAGVTAVHIADIVHPAWSRVRSVVAIGGHLAGLAILWVLYQAQPLIIVTPVSCADPVEMERVVRTVGSVETMAIGVAAVIWAVAIGIEVRRLWRTSRVTASTSQVAV